MKLLQDLIDTILQQTNVTFILVSWEVSNNLYYIPVIYDFNINKQPLFDDWYIKTPPNINNIPIRHSRVECLYNLQIDDGLILCNTNLANHPNISDIKLKFASIFYANLLNRAKKHNELILSNICHSIRTPLNGILNLTNILLAPKTRDRCMTAPIIKINNDPNKPSTPNLPSPKNKIQKIFDGIPDIIKDKIPDTIRSTIESNLDKVSDDMFDSSIEKIKDTAGSFISQNKPSSPTLSSTPGSPPKQSTKQLTNSTIEMKFDELRQDLLDQHNISGTAQSPNQSNTELPFDDALLKLKQSTITLANNIFDIIDTMQIELGILTLQSQSFSLLNMINNVILITNRNIKFHIDETVPAVITTDEKRLQQILINLLNLNINLNTTQFDNSANPDLFVYAELIDEQREDSSVERIADRSFSVFHYSLHFIIKDYGIYIDKNINDLLSSPIEMIENAKQQTINLRLSYLLSKQLDGDMVFKFTDNTTIMHFNVSITEEEQHASKTNTNIKILIVEDEKTNQIVLEQILRINGYKNITIASNGSHAISILKYQKFDLLLLDIRMPGISGFEVAKYAKGISNTMRIIGVTAQLLLNNEPTYLFDDIVYKPVDYTILLQKINAL